MRARSTWPALFLFTSAATSVLCARAERLSWATTLVPDGAPALIFADGFETGDDSVWGLPYSVWLPHGAADVAFYVEFAPIDSRGDFFFSIDTTGSMQGEITNLQNSLTATIAPAAAALLPDVNLGAASWKDFPVGTFGDSGDYPWFLSQAMTSNVTAVQNAINAMSAVGGDDVPESGYESLYQLGSGAGVTWPPAGSVPPYAGPGLGGVGFRDGTFRLAVHITDAPSHLDSDYGAAVPDAHSKSEAFDALAALGIRVLTIQSATEPTATAQLDEIPVATGAELPPCALPPSAACAAGQCCTGIDGAGVAPAPNGRCPLHYRIADTGAGISTAIVNGMAALVQYGERDVVAGATDGDPGAPDTTCFVDRIEADAFFPPSEGPAASCVEAATPADIGGSGYDDGFTGFATGATGGNPGSRLRFVVYASNSCVPSTSEVQLLPVLLNLTDLATGALLDQLTLHVLVPPAP